MYFWNMGKCPHCGFPVEIRLFTLSSGLGPSEIQCLKCSQCFVTGRMEWPQMTIKTKFRFFFITLIYMIALGGLTGNFIDQAYQLWQMKPVIINLRHDAIQFQIAACIGGFIAFLLQFYRIGASCRRYRNQYRMTLSEFIFGLQWNLQLKCFFVLIAIWGIAKIRYMLL